jgi:hypothetical protein
MNTYDNSADARLKRLEQAVGAAHNMLAHFRSAAHEDRKRLVSLERAVNTNAAILRCYVPTHMRESVFNSDGPSPLNRWNEQGDKINAGAATQAKQEDAPQPPRNAETDAIGGRFLPPRALRDYWPGRDVTARGYVGPRVIVSVELDETTAPPTVVFYTRDADQPGLPAWAWARHPVTDLAPWDHTANAGQQA